MENERKLDPEKFALAVVASSSYQMSIQEKLQLYMDAYEDVEDFIGQSEPSEDT